MGYSLPALADECEGSFGPGCTLSRLHAADVDQDAHLTLEERRAYFLAGDWVLASVRSALPSPDVAKAVEPPLFDQFEADACGFFDCQVPVPVEAFLEYAVGRNQTWKPTAKAPAGLKLSRKINDAVDPRNTDLGARPVIFSYRHDRIKEEEGLQILGTLSFPTKILAENAAASWAVTPALSLDVDTHATTRGTDKSDVGVQAAFSYLFGDRDWTHQLTLTPAYVTDGDFGRDVVQISGSYAFSSNAFPGRPGKLNCFAGSCRTDGWQFYWQPSLSVTGGDVRDPSGNAALLAAQVAGPYVRIQPTLAFRFFPWNRWGNVGIDLSGIHDTRRDMTYGYVESSITYDLASNVGLTLLYRRGHKAATLEEVNAWLLGLGVLFQ